MQTIPDAVLDAIVTHRPHLAALVENLRAHPDRAPQIEKALADAYLMGVPAITPLETWYLAQVAYGGPWGGDWITTDRAAAESGYDAAHLRRLAGAGKLAAIKRGKTWYVRRDALPTKAD
jgi:hypothetical protein